MPVAAAVKAVRAYHLLGESYRGDKILYGVEFQGRHIDFLLDVVYHGSIFRSVVADVFAQILVVSALVLEYEAAGNQLQRCPGFGEVDELAGIHQGRAAYAHVNFLCSVVIEVADVVAQLGASDDGIVAEDRFVVPEYGSVGYQLHLGYQVPSFLTL